MEELAAHPLERRSAGLLPYEAEQDVLGPHGVLLSARASRRARSSARLARVVSGISMADGAPAGATQRAQLRTHVLGGDLEGAEHAGSEAGLAQQPEQDVLGTYRVVLQGECLVPRAGERPLGRGREQELPSRRRAARRAGSSPPAATSCSTCARTSSGSTPASRASRPRTATPSSTLTRPSRMCSVPM